MIFEGTWSEGVWTSTDTIDDIYGAYKDGKIPVLHLPAFEYEDTGIMVTDEAYITLYKIESTSATAEGQLFINYAYYPDSVVIAGTERNIETDDTRHLVISTV